MDSQQSSKFRKHKTWINVFNYTWVLKPRLEQMRENQICDFVKEICIFLPPTLMLWH